MLAVVIIAKLAFQYIYTKPDSMMKNSKFQTTLWLSLLLLFPLIGKSQTLKGTVEDRKTSEPLTYVHIGVEGKNVGVISNDKGEFSLDLSKIAADEAIQFSIIGYETALLKKPSNTKEKLVVKLEPIGYDIQTVEITGEKNESRKLGRYEITKTTTGQSGLKDFGFGGEWGTKIIYTGKPYYLKDINFHTRFNTVDSVLYRMNVYSINEELPGDSKLQQEVFTTCYKKDKWISANILDQGLLIEEDIIVTFELVRIWYGSKGSNQLFYTHGDGYAEGQSYSRESSHDKWSINIRPALAIYVTGLELE